MADNLSIKDASGTSKVLQAKDNSSVYTPAHQIVNADGSAPLKIAAEDAAHSSGDTGIQALAVRLDSAASLAGTDGDYQPLTTDANGKLWTNAQVTAVVPGTGATALGKAEDGAHSSGDVGVMALAVRQDTPGATSGTDGDYEPLQTAGGRLWTSSTITAVVPGVGATNLGKAEDAAHTGGDVGVMALTVRQDTAAALGGTDGDYQPPITDASGRLHVNVGAFSPGTAAGSLGKAEDAAHTSGDVGVMSLTVRKDTAAATSGTDGDYQPPTTDASGRLWTHVGAIDAGSATIGNVKDAGPSFTSSFGVSGAPVTSSDQSGSAVAVTDAPTSGQKIVITDLTVSVAAAMIVTFTEETSGTVALKLYMAANSTVTVQLRGKKKLATADKKLMVQTSATGAISVDAGYFSEA